MSNIRNSIQHAWNAFQNRNDAAEFDYEYGMVQSLRPDRHIVRLSSERNVITPILNRMAIDVAAIDLRHVRVDENENYTEEIQSGLTNCLKFEANIDQASTAFKMDLAYTLFDDGVAAIVPVTTTANPVKGSYEINTMRIGNVTAWYPKHVKVNLYNEELGRREEIIVAKSYCAIVENPLKEVMNEPNSTLKRLIHKINLLDRIDDQNGSGKLNMIIQLPYMVKSEAKRKQAEQRRTDLELQLAESKYGIAYTDGTEKVTQLNGSAENNLPHQVEELTNLLYAQLGLTRSVIEGTANEQEMLNYYTRTIKPIVKAVSEAMNRAFLTKTARTQNQRIVFVRDPFELVPVNDLAEIADKFSRNEIVAPNEFRSVIGFRPSMDEKANELRNRNMPQIPDEEAVTVGGEPPPDPPLDTQL